MKIKVLKHTIIDGSFQYPGTIVDSENGENYIRRGLAEVYEPPKETKKKATRKSSKKKKVEGD